jgi:phage-related protein (TIGR01555 family)
MLGYGTSRDKVAQVAFTMPYRLDDHTLQALCESDAISAKIVEKKPKEAFRRGYKVEAEEAKELGPLRKLAEDLNFDDALQETLVGARQYGGAVLILGVDDGLPPDQPLNLAGVRGIDYITPLDRRFLSVERTYREPLRANFGKPEVYRIGAEGSLALIHESRVIRFDGTRADARRRVNGGWGMSVLQRVYTALQWYVTSYQSSAALMADASQAVFTINGLMTAIASDPATLKTRMALVDQQRSAGRAIMLDADGEKFERIATSFTGIPDVLDRMMLLVCGVADMPATVLFGRSPAGLNATGESDTRGWYDEVSSMQDKELTPAVVRFFEVLSAGRVKVKVCWEPLQAPTAKEEAELGKAKAETDKVYIDTGVLHPEEVALARFGTEQGGQIVIDEAARKKSLKEEISLALDPPPPPPPGAPVPPGAPPVPPAAPDAPPR